MKTKSALSGIPSPTTETSKLYDQLVKALKGPSQRHHQWASALKATNKDFGGRMKKSALDFRSISAMKHPQ